MKLAALIGQSLLNRRLSVVLTIVTLALSVALFLSVNRLQNAARNSFERSISGVDLILSSRGSDIQILLYTVFRLGDPINNLTWASFQDWRNHPDVRWAVPISLGDSHAGYRVMGTTDAYFQHIQYGAGQNLAFAKGQAMADLFDVVLGAEVAAKLGYDLDAKLVLAHGTASVGAAQHDDLPFRVSGILKPTGTAVDQTVLVSLEAIEAIHKGWESGRKLSDNRADDVRQADLQPSQITGAFLGLKSRLQVFRVQRAINSYDQEALSAVLPGIAFSRLWSIVGSVEQAFRAITALIIALAILGMVSMLLATLADRRREMAIFRALGATPGTIASMLMAEAFIIAAAGCLVGWVAVQAVSRLAAAVLQARLGLLLPQYWLSLPEAWTLLAILAAAILASLIPAYLVYRTTLSDGLRVRS